MVREQTDGEVVAKGRRRSSVGRVEVEGYETYFDEPAEKRGPGLTKKLSGNPRTLALRELGIYLAALQHDYQYSCQMALKLIQLLGAPERITVHEAVRRLHDTLAIQRGRLRFGRPWTFEQLRRLAYYDPRSFMRIGPMPVTDEEIATYRPRNAPKAGEHDPAALAAALKIAKLRE